MTHIDTHQYWSDMDAIASDCLADIYNVLEEYENKETKVDCWLIDDIYGIKIEPTDDEVYILQKSADGSLEWNLLREESNETILRIADRLNEISK